MTQSNDRKAVSQFPQPPRRYYHNCATDRPAPPPPPPATGAYSMFGREYSSSDVEPTLEEAGRRQLYDPSESPTSELCKLNKRLLQLFLRLVQLLCSPPPQPPEPAPHEKVVQDIEDVFINMQYLINLMRPAQAAIDLKDLLDKQTNSRQAMSSKLRDSISKAWHLVSDAADDLLKPSVQLSPACIPSFEAEAFASTTSPNDAAKILGLDQLFNEETTAPNDNLFDDEEHEASLFRPKPTLDQILLQMEQLSSDPAL